MTKEGTEFGVIERGICVASVEMRFSVMTKDGKPAVVGIQEDRFWIEQDFEFDQRDVGSLQPGDKLTARTHTEFSEGNISFIRDVQCRLRNTKRQLERDYGEENKG